MNSNLLSQMPALNLPVTGPEMILLLASLVVLVLALFLKDEDGHGTLLTIAVLGVLFAMGWTTGLWGAAQPAYGFGRAIVMDHTALILDMVILLAALAGLLTAPKELKVTPDYIALILWATIGMMVLVGATDLIVMFLGLEILSLPLYILAAFYPKRDTSLEAAVKYLLLGAFSSGFFLYGLALLYGASGATNLSDIALYFQSHTVGSALLPIAGPVLFKVATALIVVGLGFKLALVPFHMWMPDVYEGAPTPVTTFMSVGTKAAAFGAMARLFLTAIPTGAVNWIPVLWVLAIVTILLGALLTLPQTNMKRLLAYSGIVNAGYLVAALSADSAWGLAGALYFLVAYSLMNLGAFTVVTVLSHGAEEGADLAAYRGLWYKNPWLAVAMSIFLLSLASIPPTAGFIGKFYIAQALVNANSYILAMTLMVGTAITLYVYGRPVLLMFQKEEPEKAPVQVPLLMGILVAVLAVAVLQLGIYPTAIVNLIHSVSGVMVGF